MSGTNKISPINNYVGKNLGMTHQEAYIVNYK